MKKLGTIVAGIFLLAACGKEFGPKLAEAHKAFAEKNYIDTIDALNIGIPAWHERDGSDKKAEAYELLGKAYHQLHTTDKAIEAFSQAIKLSDKTFDSAYALGNLMLARNQPSQAVDYFSQALRMKPNDPQALLGLGNSLYALKRYPEASIAYEKVLDNSPGVRDAMEVLNILQRRRRSK